MIEIKDKSLCSGCTACVIKCPKGCMTMEVDSEGFLYPKINTEECIDCHVCEKVCPILNPVQEIPVIQKAYIVQNKNEKVLQESTSGGAFTEIAKYVLAKDGVVFGAAFDKNFGVNHIYIENEEELKLFRNSKYIQSRLGNTFQQVREFIMDDRWVCFSGTPCQIEGLYSYLGKKTYEKLILVDVVCHAVPSPYIFQKYLESQYSIVTKGISNILFRDKHYGYKYSTLTFKNTMNQKIYSRGIDSDPWLRAFFSNICDRPACYKCSFKKRYRVGDFTMWDCFSIYDYDKSLDNDKGVTNLLLHTDKARNVFDEIKTNFAYLEVKAVDRLTNSAKEMFHSVSINKNRERFFLDANNMTGVELFQKYYPNGLNAQIKRGIRITCYKLGIYSSMKKIARRILGRR